LSAIRLVPVGSNPHAFLRRAGFWFGKRTQKRSGFGRAVSRILSASLRTERIICLSDRYPKPVSLSRNAERAAPGFPIWPCTRWGFPCRVACASRGGLLHHLFTLTTGLRRWRSDFLWHFPSSRLPTTRPRVSQSNRLELRGIAPCGVRTFLCRLSSTAILRPSKTRLNLPQRHQATKVFALVSLRLVG